ncbi:hypothetical protein EOE67_14505 [Rheinheimera riviphila]|uniref:Cobalt transporter n=1 Tax=Rheinheimera riviphila TaxID=1834037 RepID=A0A437QLI2_9GAMM|nr:hypothetical protein [Rheinheimera riviphila]RVU35383.1 hypothetical protein EOE67_14505 [Rheinheimera riviphila]
MQKSLIRLILLMFIMLNHAVSACESLVMHLPDENHPFSVLDSSSHDELPSHQHQHDYQQQQTDADATSDNDEHHPSHAHVSCHISSMLLVAAEPVLHHPAATLQYALITTSYTPDVPPPNA